MPRKSLHDEAQPHPGPILAGLPALILACSLSVPGEPVPKGRPRLVRGHVTTPKRTADAEARFRGYLATRAIRRLRWPTDRRLVVNLTFRTASHRRVDLDNLCKLVLDASNGAVWEDDSQVDELHVWRFHGADAPRTEMEVWASGRDGVTVA